MGWPRYTQQQEDLPAPQLERKPADPFEGLKGVNPMALILLGIVIGALLVNMRPVVITGGKV